MNTQIIHTEAPISSTLNGNDMIAFPIVERIPAVDIYTIIDNLDSIPLTMCINSGIRGVVYALISSYSADVTAPGVELTVIIPGGPQYFILSPPDDPALDPDRLYLFVEDGGQ